MPQRPSCCGKRMHVWYRFTKTRWFKTWICHTCYKQRRRTKNNA